MSITKEEFRELVEKAKNNIGGVVWHVMGKLDDGRELCLVMGWSEDYEEGEDYQIEKDENLYTLCAKLAVNIDDLQCDFEWDWRMPWWKENYDIANTQIAVTKHGDSEWYNEEAEGMIKELNKGLMEVF